MAPGADLEDGGQRQSARSKRKAKEKANAKKRAAAGNVLNPYAALEKDNDNDDEGEGEAAEPVEDVSGGNTGGASFDDTRPKTSHSDASGETLVGAQDSTPITSTPLQPADTTAPSNLDTAGAEEETSKITPSDWTYDEVPDISTPDYLKTEDPDEPLTEAEIRHKEIEDWFAEQTGHAYSLKARTVEKIVDFVYDMKYEEEKAEWMKEVRLIVWRAAVRASFWWVNPDTNEPTGKPSPITAPTGVYEHNFHIFITCAAERLDRIGRDLPDPEYVKQVEGNLRLFFRRISYKKLERQLAHFAFLLLVDEEQNRILTREGMQGRLRMCFDGVKGMDWNGLGVVRMAGELGVMGRKTEPPGRTNVVWQDLVRRFGI